MTHVTTLSVSWEAAHRLPHLPGKCTNLHGHSWSADVDIEFTGVNHDDIGVEFAGYKRVLREWVDTQLDHGATLAAVDPLADALRGMGCKVYRIGAVDDPGVHEKLAMNLRWPTVETMAVVLYRAAMDALMFVDRVPDATVAAVKVRETASNAHTFRPAR